MTKPVKVLFIGEIISSHAQSFIRLLENSQDFEIKILDIGIGWDTTNFEFPVIRYSSQIKILDFFYFFPLRRLINLLRTLKAKRECESFKPDIVHTLGIFPASKFYLDSSFKFKGHSRWVVQARGGPDLAMNRLDEEKLKNIKVILNECNKFVADNDLNYKYACESGLDPLKKSLNIRIPGTGGIELSDYDQTESSTEKDMTILWPKAYNCIQSDGFVVIEGLKRALAKLPGKIKLIATATSPEISFWLKQMLPPEKCILEIYDRIPRKQLLYIYNHSKVLLAPSLSDGIPNTLYEAMASKTIPIVSPLETLTDIFYDGENVIYANNLDPEEISNAITKALTDKDLALKVTQNNLSLVKQLADRNKIQAEIVAMYKQLT